MSVLGSGLIGAFRSAMRCCRCRCCCSRPFLLCSHWCPWTRIPSNLPLSCWPVFPPAVCPSQHVFTHFSPARVSWHAEENKSYFMHACPLHPIQYNAMHKKTLWTMINCDLPLALPGTVHSTVNNPGTLSVQNRFVLLISFCFGFVFVCLFVFCWHVLGVFVNGI